MRASMLVAAIIALAGLSGCFGGGDDVAPEEEDPATPAFTEETGAVRGKVVTVDLDIVEGGTVSLVRDSELIQETRTNSRGEYALNNIEPGTYRVQVNAICCEGAMHAVLVEANKAIERDFMLTPLAELTYGRPYVTVDEFNGFWSCVIIAGQTTVPLCAPLDDSHEVKKDIPVEPGVETVSVAMVWSQTGVTTGGNEMRLVIRDESIPGSDSDKIIAQEQGGSPLTWQRSNSDFADAAESFSGRHGEEPWLISFAGIVADDPTIVYQRAFTIHYAFHYWEPAPPGYSALPDS